MKRRYRLFLLCGLVVVVASCGNRSPQQPREPQRAAEAAPGAELAADLFPSFAPLPSENGQPAANTPGSRFLAAPTAAPAPSPGTAAPSPSGAPASAANKKADRAKSDSASGKQRASAKSPQSVRAAGSLIRSGPSTARRVALTFDDAPDVRYTPQILSILAQYKVKSTFFLVGTLAKQHPDIAARIVREGHAVGNHTYRHAYLPKLSDEKYHSDLLASERALQSVVGYAPKLLRPPYGAIRPDQLLWAAEHQFVTVNWDVDSQDWRGLDKDQVMANVMQHVHPGCIILQHSGTGAKGNLSGTVKALPAIIEQLRANKYEMVTIPELLNVSKQK